MAKVSVIIPSRVETLEIEPGVSILQKMVSDIYAKAAGEIEVIVVFDGPPYLELGDYPNLVTLHLNPGLRPRARRFANGL